MTDTDDDKPLRLRRLWIFQLLTYVVARALITVVCMLPPRMAGRAGRLLGRLMFVVDRKHVKLAHKNLTRTGFMNLDDRAQGRFIRRVYEHFGTSIVENLMLPKLVQGGRLMQLGRLENRHIMDAALARGKGAVIVIGHLGNWELGGLFVTASGHPLNSIARPIENPWLDRFWNRLRAITGQQVISKESAVLGMARVFRRNEILVVLADLDARESGLFLPFFGQPASTTKSPAVFAMRYGVPIVPMEIWRGDDGVHHYRYTEPIEAGTYASNDEGAVDLMTKVNARLEEFVRRHPTQWMWMHARWKTAGRVLRKEAERQALQDASRTGTPTSGE
jgi:KDO2-lipid IV(A) lauroyltransferase